LVLEEAGSCVSALESVVMHDLYRLTICDRFHRQWHR
jgi:hypothetical protein